jgi:hypothetical protein
VTRIHGLAGLLTAAILLAGCGFEAPTPGTLHVASDPEGAAIAIDGVETGDLTPHTYTDLEGNTTYAVSVAMEGMVAFPGRRDVLVAYGGASRAEFTLSTTSGSLLVTSAPAGAAIWLDDVDTGEITPHTFADLMGNTTYAVSVTMEGMVAFPSRRDVLVPYGGSVEADFALSAVSGSLEVTSQPTGALIWLDGENTGEVTPHTFAALPVGDYLVTVSLPNHFSTPAQILVTVTDGALADADFALLPLSIPRIVLVEGFSNTYCIGCPTMNANVKHVLEQPGYGPDRVLHVKWPGANPSPLDPFYWVTQSLVNARISWYFGSPSISLPTLTAAGVLLGGYGTPYNAEGLMSFIDSQPTEADVLITVATTEDLGDVTDLTHVATVSLLAPGGADLTGHVLHVVLVYETVDTQNTGYQGGITRYHWVMRDHVQPSSDIGLLAAGQSYDHPVILNDPLGNELSGHAVYPVNKQIIAWIQHATTKAVVQAGSTVAGSSDPTPAPRQQHTGGTR